MHAPRILARKLWQEDHGIVISAELVCIASLAVIGLIVGLTSFRDAAISELSDIAGALQDFNQCYTFNATEGHSAATHGSAFVDATDHCDEPEDVAGGFDNCVVLFEPADEGGGDDDVERTIVRLEAESDDVVPSVGGPTTDGWIIWANGDISFNVDLADGGDYWFSSRLWGSRGGPDLPNAAFVANGTTIDDFDVAPTSLATAEVYHVEVTLPAGSNTFSVEFTNDFFLPPEDRNLFVDWFEIEGPG